MHQYVRGASWTLAALFVGAALAQPQTGNPSLRAAFDAAWERQPEARSFASRREAALAAGRVAGHFTAQPPSVSVSTRSGRFTRDRGQREYEAGIALPLWLPGEQERAQALAASEVESAGGRAAGARLRTAGAVREAYWAWQRARIDRDVSMRRLESARLLATDVARRVAAGDLARADSHQAQGAAAAAEATLAEADSALSVSAQVLRALTGAEPAALASATPEPAPTDTNGAAPHAAFAELAARQYVAQRALELAEIQHRGNPELSFGSARERGAFGDTYETTLLVGVRVPFGSNDRRDARVAQARAELQEVSAELALLRLRLDAALAAARDRLQGAGIQLTAAERRAALAMESRGFFERAFRLGESDLPTRLRVELEAGEAERAAARARVDLAAATSQLRQSLGLLPE